QGWGLMIFHCAQLSHPPPVDTPRHALNPGEGLCCLLVLSKEEVKAALYCAHRTSTVSSRAFCEQRGHLATPSSSFRGRALREQGISAGVVPLCYSFTVIFIVIGFKGLSNSSRAAAAILSTTSMPRKTSPKTV